MVASAISSSIVPVTVTGSLFTCVVQRELLIEVVSSLSCENGIWKRAAVRSQDRDGGALRWSD